MDASVGVTDVTVRKMLHDCLGTRQCHVAADLYTLSAVSVLLFSKDSVQ